MPEPFRHLRRAALTVSLATTLTAGAALFAPCGCAPAPGPGRSASGEGGAEPVASPALPEGVAAVSPESAWMALNDPARPLRVVNVDPPERFARAHIPGSLLWPRRALARGASPGRLYPAVNRGASPPPDDEILVTSRDPEASAAAAALLRARGFRHLRVLRGGLRLWEAKGYPLASLPAVPVAPETPEASSAFED